MHRYFTSNADYVDHVIKEFSQSYELQKKVIAINDLHSRLQWDNKTISVPIGPTRQIYITMN